MGCSAILGIQDPVVDGLAFVDDTRPDARAGDEGGEGGGGSTEAGGGEAGCGADLTTSADNCGACGHKCIVGTCAASRCQPQVLLTGAPITDYAGYVGVNSSRVVWVNKATRGAYSVPKAGGVFQQYFGTTSLTPTTLDVHESFFVLSDYDFYGVTKLDMMGGGSEDPKAEACATGLGAVADEAGAIYYAHLSDTGPCLGSIFHITKRVPQGGGAYNTAWDIPVSNFSGGASKWMVVDANNLYFDSYIQPSSSPNGIYAASRVSGASSLVLAGGFSASPMALDGATLYTIENISSATPSVVAIDLGTKVKRVVMATEHAFFEAGSNARAQIAVDATHVYWTAAIGTENPSTQGRVLRAPKDGSGVKEEVVVDAEPGLYGMAIDATFVYWSTASAIKRVAK
jgi:hypothetical protein